VEVQLPVALQPLFYPARYKIIHGGRGGAKSWSIGRVLVSLGAVRPLRILCGREYQTSIADSVHKLLGEQIVNLGLLDCYDIQQARILGINGTEFLFKGMRHNIREIKSTEGIDIAWIEEAQVVSEESWEVLIPTIRKTNSEIWASFNPVEKTDPTYQRFIVNTPPDALVIKVGWQDNPWFPEVLRREKDYLKRVDYEAYMHIWEGEPRTISDAVILKGKYKVRPFETPEDAEFLFGVDWGFAKDPTVLIRCFIRDRKLYIDQEAYRVGVDLDRLGYPAHDRRKGLFDEVPLSRKHIIYADRSRPETIRFMQQRGYNVRPADNWPGAVEDGIAFLRSFEEIVIHERCVHTADEGRLYRHKVDSQTGEVLPKIVDAHNHCWDAVRYALSRRIKHKFTARSVRRPAGY
jgi:phage terminase large subunit